MIIIISSVFAVLEGILSMEMKKMRMVCPSAVHFGCAGGVDPCPAYLVPFFPAGSKQSLPVRRVLQLQLWESRVLKRETQHQGEPLVWYQVELSRVQETSTNVREEHILKRDGRKWGRLSQKIN